MKLKTFVSQTLLAIIEGVEEAQAAALESGAMISPSVPVGRELGLHRGTVEFDVEVTTSEGAGSSAGGGIVVGMFGLSGKTESEQASHARNRIRLSVPIGFPDGRPKNATRRGRA